MPFCLIENWNTRQGCRDEMRSISRGKARQRSRRSRKITNAGRIHDLEMELKGGGLAVSFLLPVRL
jgi:hypothetical protein